MASTIRFAAAQRSSFLGFRPVSARPVPSVASRVPRDKGVAAQAMFGLFGGGKKADGGAPPAYICVVCGYIYEGEFKAAPSSYKCPACQAPKSKFKVYKGSSKGNSSGALAKRMKEKDW